MIPLFWYMLFTEESVLPAPHWSDDEDDVGGTYPYLVTDTASALARSRASWPRLQEVIGAAHAELFETWMAFLRTQSSGYLHCETRELDWMSDGEAELETEIRRCLAAFDLAPFEPRRVPWQRRVLANSWMSLLSQAAISTEQLPGNIPPESLCGYAWEEPVPWEPSTA